MYCVPSELHRISATIRHNHYVNVYTHRLNKFILYSYNIITLPVSEGT